MFQLILDAGSTGAREGIGTLPILTILIAGAVILTITGVLVHKALGALRRPEMRGLNPEKVRETWRELETQCCHSIMGAKLAVIEADKLLDGVMKAMMFPGDTMGDRLKVAQYKFSDIRRVWPAHKLRNQLVHDSAFEISMRQAKEALEDYKRALKALHVL